MFKREPPKQLPKFALPEDDITSPAREYAPRISKYADEALKSRQYVIDLEHRLEALSQELAALKNHCSVVEEANALLHERVVELEKRNEELAYINVVYKTRVGDAAHIILQLVDPVPPKEKISDQSRSDPAPLSGSPPPGDNTPPSTR